MFERTVRTLVAAAALALVASLAQAQEQAPAPEPTPVPSSSPSPAPEPPEKVAIHGFLSQAYARTDQNHLLGIDPEGTTDYRTAALLIRWRMSSRDALVVELEHQRNGSIDSDLHASEVELGWAFYERELGFGTQVRVGRVKLPLGIYTDIQDFGVALPFYRPPVDVYREGSFSSDSVDGVVVSRIFKADRAWSLDLSAFWGGWDYLETSAGESAVARVENALGAQAWLQTPLPGLRFGFHWNRETLHHGLLRPQGQDAGSRRLWQASADGTFERFFVRAEYQHMVERDGPAYQGFMAEAGVTVYPKLILQAVFEGSHLFLPPPLSVDRRLERSYGIGIRYALRRDVMLKLEHHWDEGFTTVDPVPDLLIGAPARTRYVIASVSVGF